MKSTGIVRKVDELGRLVIPKELRRTLGISERDPLEIFVEGEHIVLQKHAAGCVLCGGADRIIYFRGKLVCDGCVSELTTQKAV